MGKFRGARNPLEPGQEPADIQDSLLRKRDLWRLPGLQYILLIKEPGMPKATPGERAHTQSQTCSRILRRGAVTAPDAEHEGRSYNTSFFWELKMCLVEAGMSEHTGNGCCTLACVDTGNRNVSNSKTE